MFSMPNIREQFRRNIIIIISLQRNSNTVQRAKTLLLRINDPFALIDYPPKQGISFNKKTRVKPLLICWQPRIIGH